MLGLRRYGAFVLSAALLMGSMGVVTLIPMNCSSTVNVTGPITANTTWQAANSPYILTGDVTVDSNVTLTIEPGVEVRFGTFSSLHVLGEIVADGLSTERITFTTNAPDPPLFEMGVERWFAIYVYGEASFRYCDILWAHEGLQLYSKWNDVWNCNISHCTGVAVNDGWNTVNGNTFYDSGLYVDSHMAKETMLTNTLAGNSANGRPVRVYMSSTVNVNEPNTGQLIAINCTDSRFSGLDIEDTIMAVQVYHCENVTIADCTVSNCPSGINADYNPGCTITNCSVRDAQGSIGISLFRSSWVNVSHCAIQNNGLGLDLLPWDICSTDHVWNNTFVNNYWGSGISYGVSGGSLYMDNNTFLGCGMEIRYHPFYHTTLDLSNNTVNGLPLFVAQDMDSETVPSPVGQVILLNCSNIIVNDLNANSISKALSVSYSDNITVQDMNITDGFYCGVLEESRDIEFEGCKFIDSIIGLSVYTCDNVSVRNSTFSGKVNYSPTGISSWQSSNGTISQCSFSYGDISIANNSNWDIYGCELKRTTVYIQDHAEGNRIYNCNFTDGSLGVMVSEHSTSNSVFHNNFLNMSMYGSDYVEINDVAGGNDWDAGYPDGGNYFERHDNTDEFKGSSQDVPGRDGISDTSVICPDIFGDYSMVAEDRYPLAHPYAWWGTVPPTVELKSPENGSVIRPGTSVVLDVWDGNMDLVGASHSADGGVASPFGNDFVVDTAAWPDGTMNLTVVAEDSEGNTTARTFAFTVDSEAPEVTSTYPAANQTLVPVSNTLWANFSEPVNISTFSFNITPAWAVANEWSNGNMTVEIFLGDVTAYGTNYTARINASLADPLGNAMPDDYTWSFATPTDSDWDGIPDCLDEDDDNDGWDDAEDAFPLNPAETVDTDGDGTGNNADEDDDGDDVPDIEDAFPLDPDETADNDDDGTGNNADTDDDNDGFLDTDDAFPLDDDEWLDTDGDGTGNNYDSDDDGDGVPDADDFDPLDPDVTEDPDAQTFIGSYWWVFIILVIAIIAGVAMFFMRKPKPPVPGDEERPLPSLPDEGANEADD